jgi:hypothetical protein
MTDFGMGQLSFFSASDRLAIRDMARVPGFSSRIRTRRPARHPPGRCPAAGNDIGATLMSFQHNARNAV